MVRWGWVGVGLALDAAAVVGVVLGLVWPKRRVGMKDLGYGAFIGGSAGLVLVLGTFFALFLLLGMLRGARSFSSQTANVALLGFAFFGSISFLGAASLALAANMGGWGTGRGWVVPARPWLGGALGGVMLAGAVLAGTWTLQHGVRITWFCWLAGLPHLLLSARHLPPDMAPLPVALRRARLPRSPRRRTPRRSCRS